MSPTGEAARDFIASRLRYGIKPGLERTEALLAAVGDPQRRLRFVHVAGTNGKGSTCTLLAGALQAAGYRAGLYTSPHLIDYAERIRVDGASIDDASLLRAVDEVRTVVQAFPPDLQPTEFEVLTAVGLLYFERARVDVIVWETGLGGRFDSTNVVRPEVAVITNVDLDHTDVLGNRVEQIAYDKAGILKPGVPSVTGATGAALTVVERVAREQGVPIRRLGREFFGIPHDICPFFGQGMSYLGQTRDLPGVRLRMSGRHQVANAAVALAALECLRERGWSLPDRTVRAGFSAAYWPGRMDVWRLADGTRVILDGAHNPAGARALADSLREAGVTTYDLVLGVFRDKDIRGIVEPLAGDAAQRIWATAPKSPRAAEPAAIGRILADLPDSSAPIRQSSTVAAALWQAVEYTGNAGEDTIVVAGSLSTASEAITWLRSQPGARRVDGRDSKIW